MLILLLVTIIGCTTPSQEPAPVPKVKLEPSSVPTPAASIIYKIEFVADWSEKTHPNDYPQGAHFSPFVAYSHNESLESLIFTEGQEPTPGVE